MRRPVIDEATKAANAAKHGRRNQDIAEARASRRDFKKRSINKSAKKPGQGVFIARANAENMSAPYAVWLRYGPRDKKVYLRDKDGGYKKDKNGVARARFVQKIEPLFWLYEDQDVTPRLDIAGELRRVTGGILEEELEKQLLEMIPKLKRY